MPKLLALANLTAHRRLQTGDFPTFGCSLTEAHRGGLAPELKTQHCIEREGYLRYPADFHGLRNRVEHCVDPGPLTMSKTLLSELQTPTLRPLTARSSVAGQRVANA